MTQEGVRHCIRCNAEITLCMGFQLARDSLAAMDDKIPWTAVREHCGHCVEWLSLHPDEKRKWLMSLSRHHQ